jgi:hypothetical protein
MADSAARRRAVKMRMMLHMVALAPTTVSINQQDKGWLGEPRGNSDGDVGDAFGRLDKDLVFASKHAGDVTKL